MSSNIRTDFLQGHLELVVVKNLVGVLQYGIDDSDLPTCIGYIGACPHECGSAKNVSSSSYVNR